MAASPGEAQSLASLLLAATGSSELADTDVAALALLHARYARDRARVTAAVLGETEPAVIFNPAARDTTDE